jgi:hypothetical protein
MSNEIALVNNANFAMMAEAMGMAVDMKSKAKASNLARLKISHKAVMGEEEVKGKLKKVEIIDAGSYVLNFDEKDYYLPTPVIRLFNQRFMYKRFIKGAPGEANKYVKTVMDKDLNADLRDNTGGFNCGKPSGWIKDYNALPQDIKNLMKSIKRVRVLFGEISSNGNAFDGAGNQVEIADNIPFIWEIDNKDAFKSAGAVVTQFAKQNRILPQNWVQLATEAHALPNGESFYTPVFTIDFNNTVALEDKDQETFTNFNDWISNYNDYIIKTHNEAATKKAQDRDDELVEEFVDVDVAA